MDKQQKAFIKLGKFGREEVCRHIRVYRPNKEEL